MTTSSTTTTALDEERAELLDALAAARAGLVSAVEGLTDEQAAATPTVSTLCLGGLVKHVASVEDGWARFMADGPDALRVLLEPGDARAFVERARALVAAGRPPCPLCAEPLDATGHVCVRLNGYHRGASVTP